MARIAALLLCASVAFAQSPAFDAASVKPGRLDPGEQRWSRSITPSPAGLTLRAHTLRDCIQWAWSIKEYQLVGPAWIDSERYDISATSSGPQPPDRLRLMLQTLLIERFRLVLHQERRELPVYALVPSRTGTRLRATQSETSNVAQLPGPGLRLSFQRASAARLADFLSTLAAVARPVVDSTGLDGLYDFNLDLRAAAGPWSSEAERQTAPTVSTVLEEQLGLKLESRKQPIDVWVVDNANRHPTVN